MAASLFPPAPKPKSLLGYHRILSPSAGVRVSPLCLGAMNFGDAWKEMLGECDKETSFAMLDYFYEMGGNFIDTANNYQAEESETWIGEWMQKHQNRDEMVIATKFTTGFRTKGSHEKLKSNFQGNHHKSLRVSVEHSLRKLQTSYVDLLYVHWWDFSTSVPELMNSLHHLVAAGRVLYLGVSDTPAWLVVKCNEYARHHGLTPFCVYQGHWSAAARDFERDIIPMCAAEGMGLAPWGALGRGQFKSKADFDAPDRDGRRTVAQQSEKNLRVTETLRRLAREKDTLVTSVALAYVMHKAPYVFPIVGGRTVEHLRANIDALGLALAPAELDALDDAEPFDPGFPHTLLFADRPFRTHLGTADIHLVASNAPLEAVGKVKPIEPRQGERRLEATLAVH